MTIRDLGAPLAATLARDFGVRQGTRAVVGIAGETGMRAPRTNHEHRRGDLSSVGPQEVNLVLLAKHVAAFRARRDGVAGPRVDYPANRFVTQRHDFAAVDALVVEGTYVLGLDDLDVRIFLEATHLDTADRRRARDRDIDEPFVSEVLAIEHEIVRRQAERADLLIDREFAIRRA